ncbi:MAG: hypothetical protein PHD02_01630 [Bacilli bacterium]|nr:hypothetical protein [Bacilli bacterium]
MRESIGSTFLYNIIILFIIVTFAFLSGILSYMKAFKANSRIVNAIEKYEGYNDSSVVEINNVLNSLGYKNGLANCPTRSGDVLEQIGTSNFQYCIYHYGPDNTDLTNKDYYGVLTYMYFDLPVVGTVKIPVYSKTEIIYRFNTD